LKKRFVIKPNKILVLVLGFAAILSIGCATKYKDGELLKPFYKSSINMQEDGGKKIPVSIQVKSLDFTSPSVKTIGSGVFLSMIPIICATRKTPDQILTNVRFGGTRKVKLMPGETEKLITEELSKLNLYDEVVFNGDRKDYDIQGRVYFKLESRSILGGFGILAVLPPVLIPVILFTPIASFNFICEAHFDVVETRNNKIIFSKDYNSEVSQLQGLLYGGSRWTLEAMFGEKVFPPIVKEFSNDLQVNLRQNINATKLMEN
jgi:hypothetical protein